MAEPLPRHLRDIHTVFASRELQGADYAQDLMQRVRTRLPEATWRELQEGERPPSVEEGGHALWLKEYKGRFLKNCPGTSRYRCCGYQIAHIGENCPVGCSYCILQAYFQDRVLKAWANRQELFAELAAVLDAPGSRLRLGTGEFTDSLVLEPLTGLSAALVAFLGDYPNAVLELKSKVVDLSWMSAAKRPEAVLPAWSMNAPRIVAEQEGLAASLEERLRAARICADAGFRVCLHFDPIIRYPGWGSVEDGYPATVAMIADYLRPHEVAYVSLGSFRFMPQLKAEVERNHPHARYVYEEYGPGLDGKMRLLRPLRVEQFRVIAGLMRKAGFGDALYFCMESDEVWSEVLGLAPRQLGGLPRFLMQRAFGSATLPG